VLSIGTYNTCKKGKLISLHKKKSRPNPVVQVQLFDSGRMKTIEVHILVAKAFIPNPENLPVVTHLDKNNSNKSILSDKSFKSDNNSGGSELSQKHNNNNNGNTNNMYNKTIKDYYPTTFISRSNNNSNHFKSTNSNLSTHKKSSGDKYSTNNNNIDINDGNSNEKNNQNNHEYNISIEQLMKRINDQNIILELKDKEISNLKLTKKENEEIIRDLQEYKKNSDLEIKRCRLDISNMAKEIAELKREKKNKWINEQEYNLGKFGIQRFSHGQTIDYWEDGTKIIEVKKQLESIKNQKEEIDKQRRKISSSKSRKSQNDDNNNNYY
jgi:hypothetical protein